MGRKTCVPTKAIINKLGTLRTVGEINLKQFWNIENHEKSSKYDLKHFTKDKTRAIKILETTTKLKENCYETRLLWKNGD